MANKRIRKKIARRNRKDGFEFVKWYVSLHRPYRIDLLGLYSFMNEAWHVPRRGFGDSRRGFGETYQRISESHNHFQRRYDSWVWEWLDHFISPAYNNRISIIISWEPLPDCDEDEF